MVSERRVGGSARTTSAVEKPSKNAVALWKMAIPNNSVIAGIRIGTNWKAP